MPRQSSPQLTNGHWRTRIDRKTYYLGNDKGEAFRRFHELMARRSEAGVGGSE